MEQQQINIDPNLLNELSKSIKSEKDLAILSKQLLKLTVERAMDAELDAHLGYEKHSIEGRNTGNSRNGYSPKRLKGDFGEMEINTPRDRNSTFDPQIIRKGQTRFTDFDEQILALYARGMTTRDISDTFKELYGTEVSHSLISKVTESVIEEISVWQNRPLERVYPILYLDCIIIKCHEDKRVINKSIYLALAINCQGQKELLGLWIAETEGAKFWLSVLTELNNRGVKDIFIACVDGLTGFPDAINTVFPKTKIQLCIVHLIRNSLRYVPYKDMKSVASDLKAIYRAISLEQAEEALLIFSDKWDKKYPAISRSWHKNWTNIITVFDYPDEIRKIIYTTNAIESLNSVIRKSINNRKIFPNDQSALKVVYLAIQKASQKWTMALHDWRSALSN
ncbi:IS256 family transposase [Candidatus Cardinium hertigii]|uniref:IS256 family transposase n=1 Tax=Candidatus Cardinium hertigii TaxID=247481 RepID=UPI003D7E322E